MTEDFETEHDYDRGEFGTQGSQSIGGRELDPVDVGPAEVVDDELEPSRGSSGDDEYQDADIVDVPSSGAGNGGSGNSSGEESGGILGGVTRRQAGVGLLAALGITGGAAYVAGSGDDESVRPQGPTGSNEPQNTNYVGDTHDIRADATDFTVGEANDLLGPILGDCSSDEVYGEILGEAEVGYLTEVTGVTDEDLEELGPLDGASDDDYSWIGVSSERAPTGRDGDALIMFKGGDATYEASAEEVATLLDEDELTTYKESSGAEVGFVTNEVYCE